MPDMLAMRDDAFFVKDAPAEAPTEATPQPPP